MAPLTIHIPIVCQAEIKYVFNCLFKQFLHIEVLFKISDSNDFYIIESETGKLFIKNVFFDSNDIEGLYIKGKIPTQIDKSPIKLGEEEIPLVGLFGENKLEIEENKLVLESDIIAASFFMLARWEEFTLSSEIDNHERFRFESSLAYKFDFYHRPIVNEYVTFLITLLRLLNVNITNPNYYSATISYDIDKIKKWRSLRSILANTYNNIRSRDFTNFKLDLETYISTKYLGKKDPYDSFHFIIKSVKNRKLSAILYFKTGVTHPVYDKNLYTVSQPYLREVLEQLKTENIIIGLHPSYETYFDIQQLKTEINALKKVIGDKEKIYSRQHYLRFKTPLTWRLLNELEVTNDSSMLYSKEAGFRCGVCYSFPVFDCKNRKVLNLVESPLLFMETPFLGDSNYILSKVDQITKEVKKYGGNNIVLWHNNNLYQARHQETYLKVLDLIES